MRLALPVFLLFGFALLGASCTKPERWTAVVYANQTAFNYREVGEFETLQDCLRRGRQLKGGGFLECGLNCRYDAQGLLRCEKTVRLMDHQDKP
ncbi:MAG: hypothetical protein KIT83_19920 [Bryobacterales bacterium]|nr:hypothetical protein [Bryobacterales bacterium]